MTWLDFKNDFCPWILVAAVIGGILGVIFGMR